MSVENILTKMMESCNKEGFFPTKNIEKIAKAKNFMFGEEEWQRCPCDGQNENRYCGSELCHSDVERDGICHCRCFTNKEEEKVS